MTKKSADLEDEFLPNGYKLPDSASFMKFLPGKNKFRILSSLVTGYVYWTEDNKPIRSREEPTDTSDGKVDPKNGKVKVDHFWAVVVWNYATESIQTLEITQKGIQKYITGLLNDEAWGSPKKYDLVVTREGDGLATKYSVAANPHKEVSAEIATAFEASTINLEDMFE